MRLALAILAILGIPHLESQGLVLSKSFELQVLDMRTYTSSDGIYRFTVDPNQRTAAGGAENCLRMNGAVIWKRKSEDAFLGATVSNEGVVAGYSVRSDGQRPAGKRVRLTVFDRDGGELYASTFESSRKESFSMNATWTPVCAGVFVNDYLGVVYFRIADSNRSKGSERWRRFDYRAREPLKDIAPFSSTNERSQRSRVLALVQLGGTPLNFVLSKPVRSGKQPGPNARLELVDASGAGVWSRGFDVDLAAFNGSAGASAAYLASLLLPGSEANGFILHPTKGALCIGFDVTRDEGGWSVLERPQARRVDPPSNWSELSTEPMRQYKLSIQDLLTVNEVKLGPAGVLFLYNGATGAVSAHGRDGSTLWTHRGRAPSGARPRPRIVAAPTGLLLQATEREDLWVLLDSSGAPSQPRAMGGRHLRFRPGGGSRVAWSGTEARVLTEDDDLLGTIQRLPSGDWLKHIADAAVTKERSVLVLADHPVLRRRSNMWLAEYRLNGDPIREVEFSPGRVGITAPAQLLLLDKWVGVHHQGSDKLFLLDRASLMRRHWVRLPNGTGAELLLTAGNIGSTIYVFNCRTLEIAVHDIPDPK